MQYNNQEKKAEISIIREIKIFLSSLRPIKNLKTVY